MSLLAAVPRPRRSTRAWPVTLSAALCGAAVAIALLPATATADVAGSAPAAPAAAAADNIAVTAGSDYRVSGDVIAGGVALLDNIDGFQTASISGQASLAGRTAGSNIVTTWAIKKGFLDLEGTFTLNDPGAGVRIDATVSGGVTRVSDDTVRWSGQATVRRGTASSRQSVTVTLIDRVLDAGNHAVRFKHAGQDRNAIVRVPAGKGGVSGLSALFHFPGLLESPAIANQFDKLEPAADKDGYLLVTPDHFGFGWQGVQVGTPFPDVDDPGYIRALATVVVNRFGADRTRIYASGMSNGGFFTSLTACKLTDVFAAFAPVAGQLNDPATCKPGRKVPIVMLHGDGDPLVAYSTATTAAAFWTKNNGCGSTTIDTRLPDVDPNDGTTVIRHEYVNCPAAAPVVLYQIVGGGHAWPGGDPYPIEQLGKASKDISANQIIWDFVSRFTLAA